MTGRLLRVALASLLALLILIVGGAGLWLLAFNPNAYKSALVDLVQHRYHRRLELTGSLRLRLFPPFTLQTGPMRLSETDGATPFAQAADMRVQLDPLALLRRHVVIEGIELDAPRLQLRRDAGGRWNFADLLETPAGPVPDMQIHELRLQRGDFALADTARGVEGHLREVDADVSGIGQAGWHSMSLRGHAQLSTPRVDSGFDLRAQLHAGGDGHVALRDVMLRSDARLAGGGHLLGNLRADVQWDLQAPRSVRLRELQLRAQGLLNDGQPLQLELTQPLLQWDGQSAQAGELHASALIGAAPRTLRVQLHADAMRGTPQALTMPALDIVLARSAPTPWQLHVRGAGQLDAGTRVASFDKLHADATWGAGASAGRWQGDGQGGYAPANGLQLVLHGTRAAGPPWALQAQLRLVGDASGMELQAQLRNASMAALLGALYGGSALQGDADAQADLRWPMGDATLRAITGTASLRMQGARLQGVALDTGDSGPALASSLTGLDAQATLAQGVAQLDPLSLQAGRSRWQGRGGIDLTQRGGWQLVLRPAPQAAPRPVARQGARPPTPRELHVGGNPAKPSFAWVSAAAR